MPTPYLYIERGDWTVGDLIEALAQFPAEMYLRMVVPAGSDELLGIGIGVDGIDEVVVLHGRP